MLIWCLPLAILAATAYSEAPFLLVIWPVLLIWMGAACLYNVRSCGRRHCYVTGPFFLALAVVSLLFGLGVIHLGPHGWKSLANILLIGSLILYCVPEWIWGRYVSANLPPRRG